MLLADYGKAVAPHIIWMPVDGTDIAYVGQLVKSTGDGVGNIGQASGAADTSNLTSIYGLVVGVNDTFENQTYSSTYREQQITGVLTQAAQIARKYIGNEGMYVKGDPQPLVKVALIDATTVLRAYFYNSTYGTATSLLTVTTGSSTGVGFTSNATDHTPVADKSTSFCRTGANDGLYRISDDTSTTVETNDRAFKKAIAIGDTFVRLPVRQGVSFVQTDTEAIFFDASASPASNYWIINVLTLNFDEAGKEYCEFRFAACHFDEARA